MNLTSLLKPAPPATDELASQFHQGDMDALKEIILIHQKGIYRLGLQLFFNRDTAADFVQDVFIRAYEKCGSYNPARPFKPWLYKVANNLGRDHLRRKREIVVENDELSIDESAPKADELLIQNEQYRNVWKVVNRLHPTYREILALRFSSDLSVKEIATVLGIGLSAVKVRLCRGMKAFEDAYKARGGEGYVV